MTTPVRLALLTQLSTLIAVPALSATIRVPADQPTIQAGINVATPGDTVLVAPGVYAGSGNRDLDFAGKAVVLRSSGGATVTAIDGENLATVFHFHSGETAAAVVEGFTIQNGSDGTVYGGGALVTASSPTFRRCTFAANPANQGGALYAEQSSVALIGCTFTDNSALYWGGATYFLNASPTLTDCSFADNRADFGAAAYFSGGSGTLTGCIFMTNVASTHGGGIYCRNGASPSLTGSTFSGNTASQGAGIYAIDSALSLDDCSLTANPAVNGGGIYAEGGSLALTECTFARNETTQAGSAVRGSVQTATISGCAFLQNHAASGSGAACLNTTIGGALANSTFSDNTGSLGGAACLTGPFVVTGCTFTGNGAGIGGAVYGADSFPAASFTSCTFSGNSASLKGGAIYYLFPSGLQLSTCTFFENSAPQGGALFLYGSPGSNLVVSHSTFARNSATRGAAIMTDYYIHLTLDRSIIAWSRAGEAVHCGYASNAVASCMDIVGNAGGDWVGCIAGQLGQDGNFSADPLFCALDSGDLALAETSPCAATNSPAGCGLIGALGVGCGVAGIAESNESPSIGLRVLSTQPILSGSDIRIGIELPEGTKGRLAVYGVAGRCMAVLNEGELTRGHHEFLWSTSSGRVPSGVYYVVFSGTAWRVSRTLVAF